MIWWIKWKTNDTTTSELFQTEANIYTFNAHSIYLGLFTLTMLGTDISIKRGGIKLVSSFQIFENFWIIIASFHHFSSQFQIQTLLSFGVHTFNICMVNIMAMHYVYLRYKWNIVESSIKHHNPSPIYFFD